MLNETLNQPYLLLTFLIVGLIGGLIFLILPKKIFIKITEMFGCGQEKNTIRNIVNKSKENVCKKLVEMAGIFNEMDLTYRQMIKGKLSKKEKQE